MKQLLLGCVPLAALAAISSATAADLPVRKAPPVVPAFSWTDCGLNPSKAICNHRNPCKTPN
jgi:opacity protein-like surface antigen